MREMEQKRVVQNVLVQIAAVKRFKLFGVDSNLFGFTKPTEGRDAVPLPVAFRADISIEPFDMTSSERDAQAKRGCILLISPKEQLDMAEGWDVVFISEDGLEWEVFGRDYGDVTQLPDGRIRAKCVDLLTEPRTVVFNLPVTQPWQFV